MTSQIEESWPIPGTMVDGITERLRRAIITGTIGPGERIHPLSQTATAAPAASPRAARAEFKTGEIGRSSSAN